MSVTIRDVARRAGVSISTVSRVLNGTAAVHEDKRRSVVEAAEALGYSPNPVARSLLGKETGGIGVLLPYVSGEFFAEFLNGLDEAAQHSGRFLIISTSHRHRHEFNAAVRAMDRRVDGLVVMAPELGAEGVESILHSGMAASFINTSVESGAADLLNFDNFGGTFALTQHLLGLGHRRIAVVKGAPGTWDMQERLRGYRTAMAEAGLDTAGLEYDGEYTQAAGYNAARLMLAADPRPTAVVAANDYCAAGVLSALSEAGVPVPSEMAVAGFDGVMSAQYAFPPLTTVRVPIRDIGYRAVRYLIARLEDKEGIVAPRQEVVPVELVVRRSTVGTIPDEEA
ncbi:MAG: LacI family DNA-binding transcriptional regulator [Bacteroidota bacterium]